MCKNCGGMMVQTFDEEKPKCISCGRANAEVKCPFCNSDGRLMKFSKIDARKTTKKKTFFVDCYSVRCVRPRCFLSKGGAMGYATKEEAIKEWKRRFDSAIFVA